MKPLLKNWLFKNNKKCKFYCSKPLSLKAKGLFAFLILLVICAKAQTNLVPNPSFELYTSCPTSANQLSLANQWQNPTAYGTPDYYNGCSSSFGVPSFCFCSSVYQYPLTGNAYAGIYCYDKMTTNGREYVQIALTDSLRLNNCYLATFHTNLSNISNMACNNVAGYLSPSPVSLTGSARLLNFSAQIKKFKNPVITDTLGWVTVQSVVVAAGGEKYLTIGNFNDDSLTDTLTVNESVPTTSAYYYIDDVSIIPIDSIPGGMSAFAGNDTSVIIGDSVFIGQKISNLNCNWYNSTGTLIANNLSGIYVHPTSSTYYVVEQNLCGTITYDTVNVNVTPVGITEHALNIRVNLYPNPNNGEFTIELSDANSSYRINIADIQGRIIYEEVVNSKKSSLHPDAENGVYLVHITNLTTNETFIKKLVIQK